VLGILVTAGIGLAQEKKSGGPAPEIRKLLAELENSFNRGDAKGVAACWTTAGDFVGQSGERIEGRDNIQKAFQESLAARKHATLRILLVSSRAVSDDVALAETIADAKPPVANLAGDPGFSLVLLKRGDRWLIASARETINHAATPIKHLKDLEWMAGDWAEEASTAGGLSLHSSCGWTENRSFLIRKFTVEGKIGLAHAGTEVIGWDPRAGRLHSWIFDSNGGFGENLWVRDGGRWLINYSGTLADGSQVSATNIITRVDADTVTLESKDRTLSGVKQPDVAEVTMKRQAAPRPAAKGPGSAKEPSHLLP
jgi:uncharacterized protein (TIGR02246 family)